MTLRFGFFAATLSLSFALATSAQAQDGDARIKAEIRKLEKSADAAASNAQTAGQPSFTVKQSSRLFDSLTLSSGVSPGEERVGFVVCTGGSVSMGNVSIPECRIQAEAPAVVAENCKEIAKSQRKSEASSKRGGHPNRR